MTFIRIPEQVRNEYAFNPPKISKKLWNRILQMFLDGAVIAQEIEDYLAENKGQQEEVTIKALTSLKKTGRELKYFFESQQRLLTPRTWSALKEYYLSGTYLAKQIEQYAASNKHLLSRFSVAVNVAERSFYDIESGLNEFFSRDPYQKK